MPIIQVENLSKEFKVYRHRRGVLGTFRNLFSGSFEVVKAVDNVSFEIKRGELVGYLGPNGAGKSTSIKMLTGILVPTSGRAMVNGLIPYKERRKNAQRIGVVFGQRTHLWWDLPLCESFELLKHIYKVPERRFCENLETFEELLGLGEFLHTPVRQLSLGQRMRGDIAAALLHDPEVLFLDEPTIGLDVVAKEKMRDFIRRINRERGVTVILTTHDLGDVEKLCRRVIMIDHARIIFDGTLEEIRNSFDSQRTLVVDFSEDYDDLSIEEAQLISRNGRRAQYRFRRDQLGASELISRISLKYKIVDLAIQETQIEEIVRRVYERKHRLPATNRAGPVRCETTHGAGERAEF